MKRSAAGGTVTKQQSMQNDIAEYNKPVIQTDPRTKFDPDLPAPRKMGKSGTRTSRKPTVKALIQALRKLVEKYYSINSLVQARARITFGQIARDHIDFAKVESPENIVRQTQSGHGYPCG